MGNISTMMNIEKMNRMCQGHRTHFPNVLGHETLLLKREDSLFRWHMLPYSPTNNGKGGFLASSLGRSKSVFFFSPDDLLFMHEISVVFYRLPCVHVL